MLYLKQATASQSVLIGPFVDSTDGATAETGLTIANTDIRLSKNGGNLAAKNSGGGTHDEAGWYTITLDATDTDTVGRLQLHVKVSGALMVHHEFQVLEENVFDAWYGASAAAGTDLASILTDTAEIGTAGAGLTNINLPNQTMDIVGNITGNLSGSVGSVTGAINTAAGTITTLDALDTAQDSQHSTTQGKVDTAQADLDILTGTDGATLATSQANYAPATAASIAALNDVSAADILTTQMTESYAANGTAPTLAQAQFAIHQMLMQFGIASTSLTVKKLDNSTTAFVVTLDDATSPTGAART